MSNLFISCSRDVSILNTMTIYGDPVVQVTIFMLSIVKRLLSVHKVSSLKTSGTDASTRLSMQCKPDALLTGPVGAGNKQNIFL